MRGYIKVSLMVLALVLTALIANNLPSQLTHAAGPWYVAPGGSDSNSCSSSAAPCATINGTIGKASSSDTIFVATGVYTGTGDQVVLLDKNVTLSGGWGAGFTTQNGISALDGQGARRGIIVNSGVTTIIESFIVQNGLSTGGGIYNRGAVTLNNSSIISNTGGASIYNEEGTLTLNYSTVSNNEGNGIDNSGSMTLNRCIVSGNRAVEGGGIRNSSTLTLNDSTVTGNTSSDRGGGIYNYFGTATLNNSAVTGNTAGDRGGGINNWSSILTLNNSTVSGNTVGNEGGGIFVGDMVGVGSVTLNNVTISGNAASLGGGIHMFGGSATLRNTILAGNTSGSGPDCSGTLGLAGYNLIGNASGCGIAPGPGDVTDVDAKLGSLEGSPGYQPLLPGSPAINAGNPTGCADHLGNPLTTDQRSRPRFGRCDIGAYELQPIGFSTKTVNPSIVCPEWPVSYMITLTNPGVTDIADVRVTDTLPVSITYTSDSLSATEGSYGYSGGVITWTGTINAGEAVTITFGATAGQSLGAIVNSAVVNGGGEIITRTATVDVISPVKDAVISGTLKGYVEVGYPFIATVSPITATLPITYLWEATEQMPVTRASYELTDWITFTWNTTGTKSITVTAMNVGGVASGTYTIAMESKPKIYLPLIGRAPTGGSIYGRVTYMGNVAGGKTVRLWHCIQTGASDDTCSPIMDGFSTLADGTYSFANAPTLGANEYYYVRYFNMISASYLSEWRTKKLYSYAAGQTVQAGDFDIANVWPRAPWDRSTCAIPCTFQWDRRPASPSDSYFITLLGYYSPYPWWQNPSPLGYVGSYQLSSLPAGFSNGDEISWVLSIAGPNGEDGDAYQTWTVIFSGGLANPQVELVPGRPLSEVDLERLIEMREAHMFSSTIAQ